MTRCAIYTRTSSDERLAQEFNSLEAQQQSCQAYVRSQFALGWHSIDSSYDDGGYSGGSLDRPALQELLAAIAAGSVDVVVVYKVDRLTRALADFVRLVTLFERYGVSFVSVTQQFNTTTSMGRLTLNILLSFAQFEREITADRIRDKIAASKRKGIWMGGAVPFGYRVQDRSLIADPDNSIVVKGLFGRFLELGSIINLRSTIQHLRTQGRTTKDGKQRGARPFTNSNLRYLLSNPVYIGKVRHKGELYDGLHMPIIDVDTWRAVQEKLRGASQESRSPRASAIFQGLLTDERGDPLYVTHARAYTYYVSKSTIRSSTSENVSWRISTRFLDTQILQAIAKCSAGETHTEVRVDKSPLLRVRERRLLSRLAASILRKSCHGDPASDVGRLRELITSINVRRESLEVSIAGASSTITVPVGLRQRGFESKRRVPRQNASPDASLVQLITTARQWFDQIADGTFPSVRHLARSNRTKERTVKAILPAAFLAPDIVVSIFEGACSANLTASRLMEVAKATSIWTEQRRLLGMPSK